MKRILKKKPHTKLYSYHWWWKTECLPSAMGNKTRMSVLTILTPHSAGSSDHKNARQGSKRNTDWEGRNITLFGDDMPSHVENPKELTPKNK